MPLQANAPDSPWPSNDQQKFICHFPETREIWSFGSGYGGNALLGKKCHSLRIASVQARDEGWMAEHMLISNSPARKGRFATLRGLFLGLWENQPCHLVPTIPGWKVETVGDDIAWMRFGADGRLRAINPEAGFFGVATGTSVKSNLNAILTCQKTLFSQIAPLHLGGRLVGRDDR